jgi:hypothetical protein
MVDVGDDGSLEVMVDVGDGGDGGSGGGRVGRGDTLCPQTLFVFLLARAHAVGLFSFVELSS